MLNLQLFALVSREHTFYRQLKDTTTGLSCDTQIANALMNSFDVVMDRV